MRRKRRRKLEKHGKENLVEVEGPSSSVLSVLAAAAASLARRRARALAPPPLLADMIKSKLYCASAVAWGLNAQMKENQKDLVSLCTLLLLEFFQQ